MPFPDSPGSSDGPERREIRSPDAPELRGPSGESDPFVLASAAPRQARPPHRRRFGLPLALFILTCFSTFWAGAAGEYAHGILAGPRAVVEIAAEAWPQGLLYMAAVMGIILAHEMGHFVLTLRHRVPASLPIFIPMPLHSIGTMGAVIAMRGTQADRRQLFDIGVAGPIAGLVVAIPVLVAGVLLAEPERGLAMYVYDAPLLQQALVAWLRPDLAGLRLEMNPLLMAGWVGMLITGLNMLPISQLDGGHITYALFGRAAHVLAYVFVALAVLYMWYAEVYLWIVMLALVALIGVRHPPTANDAARLGRWRVALGLASLAIPVLCFPPRGIDVLV